MDNVKKKKKKMNTFAPTNFSCNKAIVLFDDAIVTHDDKRNIILVVRATLLYGIIIKIKIIQFGLFNLI